MLCFHVVVLAVVSMVSACGSKSTGVEEQRELGQVSPVAPTVASPHTMEQQYELWDELAARQQCPDILDPTLQAAISKASLVALQDLDPGDVLEAAAEQYGHIRPFMLRFKAGCPEPGVATGVYVFRSFAIALGKGAQFLEELQGDPTYETRLKGIEKAREGLAIMMMGFAGAAFGLVEGATKDEALDLILREESFQIMNAAGREFWIASVEQGFLANELLKDHHEHLRRSVAIAKKVNSDQQGTDMRLVIHRLNTGVALGEGWYRVSSTGGNFSVELPFLATDQTRGPEGWPTHEIVGAGLNPVAGQGPTHGNYTVRCMRPTDEKSPAELRADFQEIAAGNPGAVVGDAPYRDNAGVSITIPGQAALRVIKFPDRVCLLGVEFAEATSYQADRVERFLGSFSAHGQHEPER